MKKIISTLSLVLFTSMAFANEKEQITVKSNVEEDQSVTTCCRRSASDNEGNIVTVRRCMTFPNTTDQQAAMGVTCAVAQAEANRALAALISEVTITTP